MPVTVKLEIFTDAKDREFFSRNGFLDTFTKETAERVKVQAVNEIGERRYGSHHPGRKLRYSGRIEPADTGPPDWMVVFEHRAAVYHHTGTKTHFIGKKNQHLSNKMDPARTEGGPFYARGPVRHRGSVANPYLVNAARAIGLRVSQRPGGISQRGFARIPRGFK